MVWPGPEARARAGCARLGWCAGLGRVRRFGRRRGFGRAGWRGLALCRWVGCAARTHPQVRPGPLLTCFAGCAGHASARVGASPQRGRGVTLPLRRHPSRKVSPPSHFLREKWDFRDTLWWSRLGGLVNVAPSVLNIPLFAPEMGFRRHSVAVSRGRPDVVATTWRRVSPMSRFSREKWDLRDTLWWSRPGCLIEVAQSVPNVPILARKVGLRRHPAWPARGARSAVASIRMRWGHPCGPGRALAEASLESHRHTPRPTEPALPTPRPHPSSLPKTAPPRTATYPGNAKSRRASQPGGFGQRTPTPYTSSLFRSAPFVSRKKNDAISVTPHSPMTYALNSHGCSSDTNSWFRYGAVPPNTATASE